MTHQVIFTENALREIRAIRDYITLQAGEHIAGNYLSAFERAADLLSEYPGILRNIEAYSGTLKFYTVENHMLICDEDGNRIFILAALHSCMDLVSKLDELEPSLKMEAQYYKNKYLKAEK